MKVLRLFFAFSIFNFLFLSNSFSQITEGDTMSFLSVTYIDWPPLAGTPQRKIHATCDKVGDYCYIFRESSLTPFSQSNIDTLSHTFDKHFVPNLTSVYGPIPNVLDNDTHVFILIIDEPNWCGYFDPAQQMTDVFVNATWGSHSSEHEIIYIAGSCFGGALEITAHEFGHMLHSLQDHSPEPAINPVKYWEEAWIDEGFSTFAAIYLTENIFESEIMDYEAFFTDNPDIPLIYFSNYNQVKLWTLFMFEHYGGWDYISALISNQLNGIAGMDSALRQINSPVTFNEAFLNWSIANYLDDSNFESGMYSYSHYNFNSCAPTANHFSFPTGICSQNVNPYGSDYICFFSSTSNPMTITFSGDSNSKFRLALIKMNLPSNDVVGIDFITPDGDNNAIINAESFGIEYNKIVLVICNTDSSLHEGETAEYSYYTNSTTGTDNLNSSAEIKIFPNPTNGQLIIMADSKFIGTQYVIYELNGKAILTGELTDINTFIELRDLPEGIYYLSAGDNIKQTFKVLKN